MKSQSEIITARKHVVAVLNKIGPSDQQSAACAYYSGLSTALQWVSTSGTDTLLKWLDDERAEPPVPLDSSQN